MYVPSQSAQKARDIILIGMMGCGKTTIGRALGVELHRPLLDMDAVIEEQLGKSISDIFKEEGEAHFRSLETTFLRYLCDERPCSAERCILSTGGGVAMRQENRELLRRLGFVVWLRVDIPILIQRTARCTHRPLLMGGIPLKDRIRELCLQRYPVYAKTAHYTLDTSHMSVHQALDHIKEAASLYFR